MIEEQERVLIGVSGGADSVALTVALQELGYAVAAAHLNHGLRGAESDEDQRFVESLAARLGLTCFVRRTDLQGRSNLESVARTARREFFEDLVKQHDFSRIALAHHREDRAETLLMNLLRGAGSEGLASMWPVSGAVIRPLIDTGRQDIEAFLKSRDLQWRVDSTNFDLSRTRNRLRHEVIPHLSSLFNPNLGQTLAATSAILQDEDAWMQQAARDWLSKHAGSDGLDAELLAAAPAWLARRVIRLALRGQGSTLRDVTFEHVEKIRGLLKPGKSGKRVPVPGGLSAFRDFERLRFAHPPRFTPDFEYELPIPGSVLIPDAALTVSAQVLDSAAPLSSSSSTGANVVDGDRLGTEVLVRSWRPGDYYRPNGMPGGKLKKLFQKSKLPRIRRSFVPIVAAGDSIVWVPGFPVSREFVPGTGSGKIVVFEALPQRN